MTKKILLSGAVLALLTTTAFAGTIDVGTYYPQISQESFEQNGLDEMNFGNFRYTFDTNRSSGSISDPLVTIDVTDLEFDFDFDSSVNTSGIFEEDGNGTKPLSLATEDEAITELEKLFSGSKLVDMATDTATGLTFQEVNIEDGRVTIDFDGDATNELKKGHTYVIVDSNGDPIDVPYKFDDLNSPTDLTLKTYSQTLDINFIDEAEGGAIQALVPQFKVSCIRKFDGLINFENDRTSFVNPEHGERAGDNDGDTNTDTMIVTDRMIFSIDNARTNDGMTRWMAGNKTEFSFTMSNTDNTFVVGDLAVEAFSSANAGNVDTKIAGDLTGLTVSLVGNTFVITTDNVPFAPGKTTFEAQLTPPSNSPIRPVKFINASTDLEQGLDLNENESSIVITADADGDYVLNTVDNHTEGEFPNIRPAIDYEDNQTAGEWMDHAYIAQIAGVGHNDSVLSRIFITNRSCADVKPTFKVIQNGVVQSVTNIGNYKNSTQSIEISVDSQNIYQLKDIIDAAVLADTTNKITASGVYAIEIVLPGVAEDFYVYAQSKNSDNTNTYDLPVYNTSARD